MYKKLFYSLLALAVVLSPTTGIFNAEASNGFTNGSNRQALTDLTPYNQCRRDRDKLRELYTSNFAIFYHNAAAEIQDQRQDLLDQAALKKDQELNETDRTERSQINYINSKKNYYSVNSPLEEKIWSDYQAKTNQALTDWRTAIKKTDSDYQSQISNFYSNNTQYSLASSINQIKISHWAEAEIALNDLRDGCSRNMFDRTKDLQAASKFITRSRQIDNKYEQEIRNEAFNGRVKSDVSNAQTKRNSTWDLAKEKYQSTVQQYRNDANDQINQLRALDTQSVRNFCDRDLDNTTKNDLRAINNSENSINNWLSSRTSSINNERQKSNNKFISLISQTKQQFENTIQRAQQKYGDQANAASAINNYKTNIYNRLNTFMVGYTENRNSFDNVTDVALNTAKQNKNQAANVYQQSINNANQEAHQACSRQTDGHRNNYNAPSEYKNKVASARNNYNNDLSNIKSNFNNTISQANSTYRDNFNSLKSTLNSDLRDDKNLFLSQIKNK